MEKENLSVDVLKIIESVDDNVEEMWDRLDNKYGKPSFLVDIVMNDIKKYNA